LLKEKRQLLIKNREEFTQLEQEKVTVIEGILVVKKLVVLCYFKPGFHVIAVIVETVQVIFHST